MKPKHKPKVIAIYRPSFTGMAAKRGTGIAVQKAAVARAANHHGLEVTSEIKLNGAHEAETRAWSRLGEALRKIRSGEIDGMVVSSLEPLLHAWDSQVTEIINHIGEAQACIYTEREALDLKTPEGCFTVMMEFTIQGYERKNARNRLAVGKALKRQKRLSGAQTRCPGDRVCCMPEYPDASRE